jgi:hypothetical protein
MSLEVLGGGCTQLQWWGLMGRVNEERRLGVVQGGELLEIDVPDQPQAYIPCAVCRAPIAIDNTNEPLPSRLTCHACGTLLER